MVGGRTRCLNVIMRWIASCSFALLLSACATADLGRSRTPVPESLVTRANCSSSDNLRRLGA